MASPILYLVLIAPVFQIFFLLLNRGKPVSWPIKYTTCGYPSFNFNKTNEMYMKDDRIIMKPIKQYANNIFAGYLDSLVYIVLVMLNRP